MSKQRMTALLSVVGIAVGLQSSLLPAAYAKFLSWDRSAYALQSTSYAPRATSPSFAASSGFPDYLDGDDIFRG
jgi:hypothetical protein